MTSFCGVGPGRAASRRGHARAVPIVGEVTARQGDWEAHPLTHPESIPPPTRIWTSEEMDHIREGYIPHMMEEKWFIFMEGNRLFAHRSWTGLGVYEATFAPVDGGYVISSAVVTGDRSEYERSSDQDESLILEMFIAGHLLDEVPSASGPTGQNPILRWELAVFEGCWELAVPTFPKGVRHLSLAT